MKRAHVPYRKAPYWCFFLFSFVQIFVYFVPFVVDPFLFTTKGTKSTKGRKEGGQQTQPPSALRFVSWSSVLLR